MNRILKSLVLLGLAVAVALPLSAQDAAKKKKKKQGKGAAAAFANIVKRLETDLDLTDEQSAKIKELQSVHGKKLAAANETIGGKRRDIAAAMKKAKADGLKGKAAAKAAEESVNLTDEEKAALAEFRKITGDFQREVLALLTPEQREKSGLKIADAKKKGGKKKNKDNNE